jgi:ribose 5-phosphate isomerase B
MKIAVGTDERTAVSDYVVEELKRRGHQVEFVGPLADETYPWPEVARTVGEKVAGGQCAEGVLFCWTGTGVSIAANKVPGVRAALCADAETAKGARAWNDANVLCLSLRATSQVIAGEILEAWFSAEADPSEAENVARVKAMDEELRRAAADRKGTG